MARRQKLLDLGLGRFQSDVLGHDVVVSKESFQYVVDGRVRNAGQDHLLGQASALEVIVQVAMVNEVGVDTRRGGLDSFAVGFDVSSRPETRVVPVRLQRYVTVAIALSRKPNVDLHFSFRRMENEHRNSRNGTQKLDCPGCTWSLWRSSRRVLRWSSLITQ